jgi:hypothetical protein
LSDGAIIPNVKEKIKSVIEQQYNQALSDLKSMGYTDLDKIQDVIQITLSN